MPRCIPQAGRRWDGVEVELGGQTIPRAGVEGDHSFENSW
jgi:hypothetical protein